MAKTEHPPIYVMRRGDTLVPEMQADAEMIRKMQPGERIRVDLRTGRSPARLRFYWSFLAKVVQATECTGSPEVLHDLVKVHTGYVNPVMFRGHTYLFPASIAFSSMTEETFDKFCEAAIRFIAENYGVTPEDVFPDQKERRCA